MESSQWFCIKTASWSPVHSDSFSYSSRGGFAGLEAICRHLKSGFPGIDNVFNFLFSPWALGGGGGGMSKEGEGPEGE